jgi:hypothetical protein
VLRRLFVAVCFLPSDGKGGSVCGNCKPPRNLAGPLSHSQSGEYLVAAVGILLSKSNEIGQQPHSDDPRSYDH